MAHQAAYSDCFVTDSAGYTYPEFTCMYPSVAPFYLEAEKEFDCTQLIQFFNANWHIPFGTVTAYLVAVYCGRTYMRERKPWDWKGQLALWNLALCIFSTVGFFKTFPHLIHNIFTMTTRDNICVNAREHTGGGSTSLWVFLFSISKFPELIDTFFIVIHKKKLMFLHWYHHITVLLYCWRCFSDSPPYGIVFVAMNFGVHSLMYGYYFLMAIKMKPKWLNPIFITFLQVMQMVVGTATTLAGYYYLQKDDNCAITKTNVTAGFLMYGSYLFLFAQFFVSRYFCKARKLNKQKKEAAAGKATTATSKKEQ